MDIDEARRIVAGYAPPYSQTQKAMRRAFGVTTTAKSKRRRRRRKRQHREPSRKQMDECRRQKHGVTYDG